MTEAEQRLAEVRAAISKILATGQIVRKGDRSVQYAELASLQKQEAQLQQQIATARRGRNRISYLSI
jgi:cell division protein FtsB